MHNSVHIKLEHDEAIELKKNALLLEKDLLEVIKHIRNYNVLRKKEFTLKEGAKKSMAILTKTISSVEADLPREEIRELDQENEPVQELPKKTIKLGKSPKQEFEARNSGIESEIDEIRARLASLG